MGIGTGNVGQLALTAQAGGAAISTIGAVSSAVGQKSALNAQAGIDDTNARLAELGAQSVLLQGQSQEQQSMISTANLKSKQRVALAANGVDLGVGSAARQLTSTDVLGAVDANTIHANAIRSAFGYRTQAVNLQNDALQKRSAADSISPISSAASTLLGSGGQVAGSWYQLSKVGAFDRQPAVTDYPSIRSDVPIGAPTA